ncbi:hypothetical protein [Duganella aceris]|uniref:Uncharacterized protein n=1 Tax=Duganella aceris TaxID=2703883 RepID=A0ABX0FK87_9BURK|nr:hypothetical protein [Duganella aceris]NGZ84938.1 hypothetical protein [Duganella aceris]
MQRDDERPPSTGRPSLLSKEQPTGADRNNILNGLEGKNAKPARAAAAAPAASQKGNKGAIAAGVGVLLLALVIGGVVWMNGEPDVEPVLAHATVPAATPITPPAATPVPAVAPPVAAAAPETATIVEDTASVSPATDNTRSLKDMLNDTPAAAKPPRDELTAALESPHAAAKPKPKLAQAKTEKPQAKTVKLAQKTEPAKAKAKPAPDSDVALLAALMAHVQAGQPAKTPSTPAYLLKQCGLQNEVGAAQCRAHLCANAARKEPECKNPAPVKTASES